MILHTDSTKTNQKLLNLEIHQNKSEITKFTDVSVLIINYKKMYILSEHTKK